MLQGLAAGGAASPSTSALRAGSAPGQRLGVAGRREGRKEGLRGLLGEWGCLRGWGLEDLWGRSQCPLSPQRLKDEIAEVTNEIENLGSTEER